MTKLPCSMPVVLMVLVDEREEGLGGLAVLVFQDPGYIFQTTPPNVNRLAAILPSTPQRTKYIQLGM